MHKSFSAALTEDFVKAIPDELLRVVDDVRELTGITVTAQPYSEELKREQPGLARAEALLDINPALSSITIWFDPSKVSPATIGHELIHLRRNILESVPKLFPHESNAPEIDEEIYLLENELEHLLIVPEQISLFPESERWWADHYGAVLSQVDRGSMSLMLAWSFIRNVLPQQTELAQTCGALVQKYDFVRPADYFREDMKVSMPNKRQMIDKLRTTFPKLNTVASIGRYAIDADKLVVHSVSV